jgi:hypothetical protein
LATHCSSPGDVSSGDASFRGRIVMALIHFGLYCIVYLDGSFVEF